MGKTEKDTDARVAGRRKKKNARRSKCAWIIYVSSVLDSPEESLSTSLLTLSSSQIFTEPFCSLDSYPFDRAIASLARPTFVSSLIDVFSFVLRCFRFFERVHGGEFSVGHVRHL